MTTKFRLRRFFWSVFITLLVACGNLMPGSMPTSVPTVTATATIVPSITPFTPSITPSPNPTITPLPTNPFTTTLEPDTPPGCMILNEDEKVYVLSDDVFFAYGPSAEELDQVLTANYPEWANYEQNVSWYPEPVTVGKIVREASFQERFALNPAVTLVTLGESLNWQLPANTDLFLQSLSIGERLHHLWFEWTNPENEQIRAQFPEVTNAATYALYVFFGYDLENLRAWCMSYQELFGTAP